MVCIVSPLIPTEGDSAEQIDADNKLFVMYDKLQQRLARMPQLLTMFEQLHSAQVRGDYEKYVDHRYEFDSALKKYELAPGLIRALHRFNNSMAPHKKIAWWKRKGVMIPLALAVAATGLFAGVRGIRYTQKRDERLIQEHREQVFVSTDQQEFDRLPRHEKLLAAREHRKKMRRTQKEDTLIENYKSLLTEESDRESFDALTREHQLLAAKPRSRWLELFD
jgi:hypothetical protein